MKSDRLERKTHFKRLSSLPGGDVTLYDLTADAPVQDVDTVYLADLLQGVDPDSAAEEIAARPEQFRSAADVMGWAVAAICHSPTAHGLLTAAAAQGWALGLAPLDHSGFYLDVPGRVLVLDHFALLGGGAQGAGALGRSAYFRNALLTTFIRALRDIDHEEKYGPFEQAFGPEDVLMLERVRAADCDTVTILAGWELRGAGFSDVWRHLLGAQEGDMALVFTRCLERDPTALFDGAALAYAFRQWYADDVRVDGCDHTTLEALDDLLLENEGGAAFGKTRLIAAMLEELATLPDGTMYLAGMGDTILKDPFFAGLNDPINQTHLFHLIYDMEVTMVNNVPFRDARLARLIFPTGETVVQRDGC